MAYYKLKEVKQDLQWLCNTMYKYDAQSTVTWNS